MSNVLIDRQKIDILANAISDKSGVPVTMTLDEMREAVDSIEAGSAEPVLQAKTYTVDSAGTETITADSGYDGLSEVEVSVPSANPHIGASSVAFGYYTDNGVFKWRYCGIIDTDPELGGNAGYIDDGEYIGEYTVCNAINTGTSVTPTESAQTIGGSDTMMRGAVTVNAIPSNYVGSGITQRSSSDLTASGATVTVPSGYYSAQASKAVSSGTEGTPTATKGTVSNHSISVTPSVTNTAGYISGGTKTGTAVSVSASELVSGTLTISSSGTKDVTNYASASVSSGSATPASTISATGASVSTGTNTLTLSKTVSNTPTVSAGYISSGTAGNSSVSLTASVTTQAAQTIYPSTSDQTINSGRYLTGNQTIKAVTTSNLTADNIKSGVTVTVGDSADADRIASVTGTYTGGGTSKNVQVLQSTSRTSASSLTKVLGDLTVSKTGTYDVYWSGGRSNTSTSYTWGTRLYIDGTGYGTENTTWTNNCQSNHLTGVSLTANQKLSVYARGRTGSYYTFAPMLVIIEA